jgi:hypothetical protein
MRNPIEVMRVLRVPPLGKLVVEVNGQRYENLSEITEDNLRHRLLAAVGELIVFAGDYKTLVDAGVAPPLAPPGGPLTPAMEQISPTPAQPTLEKQQATFLASLEAQREATKATASAKPRFSILRNSQPPLEAKMAGASDSAGGLNIVDQIDAILQKHIAADPALAGRSIHLVQDPAGGLRIEVDGHFYQRPREIEEDEIQQVIKQALKEWESS